MGDGHILSIEASRPLLAPFAFFFADVAERGEQKLSNVAGAGRG